MAWAVMVTGQVARSLSPGNLTRAQGSAMRAAPDEQAGKKYGKPSHRRHHFETE
jgi:hypothetical protein